MALQDILSKFNTNIINRDNVNVMEGTTNVQEPPKPIMLKQPYPDNFQGYGQQDSTQEQDVYKPLFEGYYRNTVKQPKELSEKGIKSSRTIANLGDTFSLLGEMIGAGAGVRVQRRNATVASEQSQNEKQAVAQNNAEMNQWNQGLYQAKTQDEINKLNVDKEKRAMAHRLLLKKEQYKMEAEKRAEEYKKWLEDHNLKVTDSNRNYLLKKYATEQKKTQDDRSYALEKEKVGIMRQNANKETKDRGGIVINAHPSDPNAETDNAGNRVIKYDLSKSEIQNIAGTAKSDQKFINQNAIKESPYYGQIMIDKYDNITGIPHKGLTTDEELARLYLQFQHDSKYNTPKEPEYTNYLPGGKNSPVQQNTNPFAKYGGTVIK